MVVQDRGLSGFFSGSSLRISRKAASSAIAWSVYEAVLLFLKERDSDA
jgi:solute carrier family 25 protein 38